MLQPASWADRGSSSQMQTKSGAHRHWCILNILRLELNAEFKVWGLRRPVQTRPLSLSSTKPKFQYLRIIIIHKQQISYFRICLVVTVWWYVSVRHSRPPSLFSSTGNRMSWYQIQKAQAVPESPQLSLWYVQPFNLTFAHILRNTL